MNKDLKTMKFDELIDEIVDVSNSRDIPSESNYLIELREEIENRLGFMNDKIFRLANIAHIAIDFVGIANYDERIATAKTWVDNIYNAKEF